jgi:heptosyltransferase III
VPEKRGKILVIRGGAIGDFILTLPAIAALRRTFPETHLEVLGYPQVAELARAAGIIDSFRSIEARALAGFFARNGTLDPELSAHLSSFNLIVSYLYDPDDFFKVNVGRATKAQFIQGPHRPKEEEGTHAVEVFLRPLERLAIFGADTVPRLSLEVAEELRDGLWIATHPGSGSEKKNWPIESWQEFFGRILAETNYNVFLVAGEAEGERLAKLRLEPARMKVARNYPLVRLAGLISQCEAFLGHDSGITHLAAALGVPTLALWGPSKEEVWRPLSPGTRVLKASSGLESLSPATVFRQFIEMLKSGKM